MNTGFNNSQRPALVNVIAWMTLASGVVNLFWGIVASGTALSTIVGVICLPLTILPTIFGVFELIYAAKLFSNPAQPVRPSTNIAVFEIACVLTGNVFAMVVGILALVFYNDTIVRDYFARLNGTLTSGADDAPATLSVPIAPASLPEPEAAPDMSEESTPAEESPAPQPEETPEKPKRTPRKVAKK